MPGQRLRSPTLSGAAAWHKRRGVLRRAEGTRGAQRRSAHPHLKECRGVVGPRTGLQRRRVCRRRLASWCAFLLARSLEGFGAGAPKRTGSMRPPQGEDSGVSGSDGGPAVLVGGTPEAPLSHWSGSLLSRRRAPTSASAPRPSTAGPLCGSFAGLLGMSGSSSTPQRPFRRDRKLVLAVRCGRGLGRSSRSVAVWLDPWRSSRSVAQYG